MSDYLEAALPAVACGPSADARAGRLNKFQREKVIVDYLDRGISVSEILASRLPAPPEEFVAIQVSRLNEALLVAYSAMSPTNLRAVDRVVRIVRELDRYHGFSAAERRLPEASRPEAAAEDDLAFEGWLDGPENPSQDLENIKSASGSAALSPAEARREGETAPQAKSFLETPPQGALAPEARMDGRPEYSAQELEKIDSAPGYEALSDLGPALRNRPSRSVLSLPKDVPGRTNGAAQWIILRQAHDEVVDVTTSLIARLGSCLSPENPLQQSEKIKSAPESARRTKGSATVEGAAAC